MPWRTGRERLKLSFMRTPNGLATSAWITLGLAVATTAHGQAPPLDAIVRSDGSRTLGRFVGKKGDFRFQVADGGSEFLLGGPNEIEVGGSGPGPNAGLPSVQVVLGSGQSISGQLVGLDESTLRLGRGRPGSRSRSTAEG